MRLRRKGLRIKLLHDKIRRGKCERKFFRKEELTSWDGYGDSHHVGVDIKEVENESQANLISSLCESGYHAPVIDLDFSCELIPSKTNGHYHLLINKEVSWEKYRRLLAALHDAGLINPGWYRAALKAKQSFIRTPKETFKELHAADNEINGKVSNFLNEVWE